ncbi:MAG: hypothetical protein WCK89_15330 [bacterium]
MNWICWSLSMILLFSNLLFVGCDDRPSAIYYRDNNMCLSSLHAAYGKIALDVIETNGKNTIDKYAEVEGDAVHRPECPVNGKRYLVNTNLAAWKSGKSSEAALICPETHPSAPLSSRKYQVYTFAGELIELSELPTWAISAKNKR